MSHFQFRRPQSYLQNGWSESRQILCAGRAYQVLALQWQTTHLWTWSGSRDPFFSYFARIISLELVKLCSSNYVCWLTYRSTSARVIYFPQQGCVRGHVISLNFGKYVTVSWKRCRIEPSLQWKTNRKSYVAYRMVPLPMAFSDLVGHLCCLKPFCLTYLGKYSV